MYKASDGKTKFSFTNFLTNAVPNLASAPHDTNLSPQEQDLAFIHQLGQPDPLQLSPTVFAPAGITREESVSRAIHKALLKNGVLEPDAPTVHTQKITRHFANQVPGITSHAQKKLVNFLFFWEEECQRWRKLGGELEELEVVVAEERESGGDVGSYEKRLVELRGQMRLRPGLRSQKAQADVQLPGYTQK